MPFIRRKWTPQAADEWKKEDWIAIFFSALSYILLSVGSVLSILLLTSGFIILALGIACTLLMYWVIDPKLRTISAEYETKQKDYLIRLENIQKWEDHDE